MNNRVTVPWAIQKARRGNAGLDEDQQSRVQAGARLLPADREFSAEGVIDDGAQFADLSEKIAKFEVELNNNLTRYSKPGGRMLKTKFKLARKRSIC
jgi:hypothetical protein